MTVLMPRRSSARRALGFLSALEGPHLDTGLAVGPDALAPEPLRSLVLSGF